MTRFKTTLPDTSFSTVLPLASLAALTLTTAAFASPQKQHATPAKPKASAKKSLPLPHPQVIVISARQKPTREMVASVGPLRARATEQEPEDENTINVRLETGDEELDHTQGLAEDPIAKMRAAQDSSFGPRNGRVRNTSLVSRALSYRGARYRFGATGGGGAFDCSGFVQHLMRTAGVSISRTAAEQFHGGRAVSRDDLQPGDLVFFRNTYKHGISHVGMFVGNGLFVHAASQKRGVVVDPLDLPYYNGKYAGARRYK